MTSMQLMLVASLTGALLFFAAGAITIVLRHRVVRAAEPELPEVPGLPTPAVEQARIAELELLRRALAAAQESALEHQAALDEQITRVRREATTRDAGRELNELKVLRDHGDAVSREIKEGRERAAVAERELAVVRERAGALDREVTALRTRVEQAEAAGRELSALRARADAAARDGDVQRARADTAEAALGAVRAAEQAARAELTQVADERTRDLAAELERTRSDLITAGQERDQLQQRLTEAEQQLAERVQAVRDLSTEAERLKGRVSDAEALRADYVRLRTTATESTFLQREVARLEEEVRTLKVHALGAPRRRPARGSQRPAAASALSIGESLSTVIERFSDAGTRSIAIADALGFPLASSGDDGLALAAFGALLTDAANRARELLPVAAPAAIELIDENGARISVWTFDVDNDRLMLVNLAVTPVDTGRVEAALADLSAILAPTSAGKGSYT